MRREITWACLLCHKSTGRSAYLHICVTCRAGLEPAGLHWCNHCRRAVTPAEFYRKSMCLACNRDKARRRYANDPAVRERSRARSGQWQRDNAAHVRAYMHHWRAEHPGYYRRYQSRRNVQRRMRYAVDPIFREKHKARARRYAPLRQYKLRVIR
jgi:hypothetical protein